MASFELGKPPIVEAWIRAVFQPPEEAEPWNWNDVADFLEGFSDEMPVFEVLPSVVPTAFRFDKENPAQGFDVTLKPKPEYMRCRTESRSSVFQVGKNEFVLSIVRDLSDSWSGFGELLKKYRVLHENYVETFQPVSVKEAELHFVDLVVIPGLQTVEFELKELFNGAPELPKEPFGQSFDCRWSQSFVRSKTEFASVELEMLRPDDIGGRFRLDWHYWCHALEGMNANQVADRLTVAHNYMNDCFQAIFTDKVWKLFEPEQD